MKTYKKSIEVNDFNYIFRSQIPDKELFDGCCNDSFLKKNDNYIYGYDYGYRYGYENENKNENENENNKFLQRSNTNNTNYNYNYDNYTYTYNTNRSINITNNTDNTNFDKNNYGLFTQKKFIGEDIISPISKTEMGKIK
jgi:hypothetical protein